MTCDFCHVMAQETHYVFEDDEGHLLYDSLQGYTFGRKDAGSYHP